MNTPCSETTSEITVTMEDEEVVNDTMTDELNDQVALVPSSEAIEDSQHEVDDQRGQKRALDTSDGNLDTSDAALGDSSNTTKDLPPGVTVSWTDNVDAIATFSSVDNRMTTIQLCLVGRARICCLEGEAEVLGHKLLPNHPEGVTVGSPFWSSWMTITVTLLGTDSTKLQFCSIRGTPSFRLVQPTRPTIIPPSWKSSVDKICQDFVTAAPPTRQSLEDDPFHHSSNQVVMICGAKGVGKSTLLRYLTNRLLQSYPKEQDYMVAILDADVGQPELAPPGMLRLCLQRQTLLHPPHWNLSHALNEPTEQIGATYYGAVTSKVDPSRYIENIQQLFRQYKAMLSQSSFNIPLVVNLDGWVKGMGFEILSSLISAMKPSHVCQLLGESKGKTFDISAVVSTDPDDGNVKGDGTTVATQLFFLDVCNKYVTPVTIPSSTLRTLRLSTYFGPHLVDLWDKMDFIAAKQLQTDWVGDEDCTLAHYLAQELPYCVPMEAVQCLHTNMTIVEEWEPEQQESHLLQSLNGSIVGLCTNNHQDCLGLGIVRSIDWRKRLFYILTPVPQNQLINVTTLVGGNIPLPLPFVFRGAHAESFPYLATTDSNMADSSGSGDGGDNTNYYGMRNNKILGSEPMKSRNNIGRRAFTGGGGRQG